MDGDSAGWYQSLDPAKREAIRELYPVNRKWNLIGVVFVAIWAVTAVAMLYFDTWPVLVVGYVVIGFMIHGMAVLMHEGVHGSLFRNQRWDRWCGFVLAAPTLFSFTAYRINHLLHHRFARTERDPDEFTNVSTNRYVQSMAFYGSAVFGTIAYSVQVPVVAWNHANSRQRWDLVVERLILTIVPAVIIGAAVHFGYFDAVLNVWLIPFGVAMVLANFRAWAEHPLTSADHPLRESRTITSNRLFSLLFINGNYHLDHHLFPAVPWYHLPQLHAILLDEYRAAGSSVYRSYLKFLFDAARLGIHKNTPVQSFTPPPVAAGSVS